MSRPRLKLALLLLLLMCWVSRSSEPLPDDLFEGAGAGSLEVIG